MNELKALFRRSAPVVVGVSAMALSGLAAAAGEVPAGGFDSTEVITLIKGAVITVGLIGTACMGIHMAIKGFHWAKSAIK